MRRARFTRVIRIARHRLGSACTLTVTAFAITSCEGPVLGFACLVDADCGGSARCIEERCVAFEGEGEGEGAEGEGAEGEGETGAGEPLAAVAGSSSTDEDTAVTITLASTGGDGAAVAFVVTAQPSFGSVTINGDQVEYTPDDDANGIDTFSYLPVQSGAGGREAEVVVEVVPVNDPPRLSVDPAASLRGYTELELDVPLVIVDPEGDVVTTGNVDTTDASD